MTYFAQNSSLWWHCGLALDGVDARGRELPGDPPAVTIVQIANGHLWQKWAYITNLGVPALLLLLSLFPYLSVLTNIAAIDRVLIHILLLRASPSHKCANPIG